MEAVPVWLEKGEWERGGTEEPRSKSNNFLLPVKEEDSGLRLELSVGVGPGVSGGDCEPGESGSQLMGKESSSSRILGQL